MGDETRKQEPYVALLLHDMEPARVLARRRQGLAGFHERPAAQINAAAMQETPQEATPPEAVLTSDGKPSPWVGSVAASIDKAALPSAMTPAVEDPSGREIASSRPVIPRRDKPERGSKLPLYVGTIAVAIVAVLLVVSGVKREARRYGYKPSKMVVPFQEFVPTEVASVPLTVPLAPDSVVLPPGVALPERSKDQPTPMPLRLQGETTKRRSAREDRPFPRAPSVEPSGVPTTLAIPVSPPTGPVPMFEREK
jgi:hypothetical protein